MVVFFFYIGYGLINNRLEIPDYVLLIEFDKFPKVVKKRTIDA